MKYDDAAESDPEDGQRRKKSKRASKSVATPTTTDLQTDEVPSTASGEDERPAYMGADRNGKNNDRPSDTGKLQDDR